MTTVFIPPQLRSLCGGEIQVEVTARTVREAVQELERRFPGVAARLCDGDQLVRGLAVSVGGTLTNRGLAARLEPTSELHFLPAIGGG